MSHDVGADLRAPDLRVLHLDKSFGRNSVLKDLSLQIRGGEFVGLMGPNGAGKSTLIKILDGVYTPSGGTIHLGGRQVEHLGAEPTVAFIHQDLGLVDALSISDNLRLGQRPLRTRTGLLDRRAEMIAAHAALTAVGLALPVSRRVGGLSPGEKTLVAIARALYRGSQVLFVDEATSTLPTQDADRVIASLRNACERGATVVMVSHKLGEILHATDRVILLLDGRVAADASTQGMDRSDLVRMLARHESVAGAPAERDHQAPPPGEVLLELLGASAGRAGPIDLALQAGEVLGLTGLPGSGLHDVAFLAHGAIPLSSGRRVVASGVASALVPPHRETQGGFDRLCVSDNLTISALRRWRSAFGVLATARERHDAGLMIEELSVVPADAAAEYGVLSGGNKQKVVFGRALLRGARIFVLCEPTRGVDVAARHDIYALIRKLRDDGAAVFVVTSDAEDLFSVCDRVCVIRDGAVSEGRSVAEIDSDLMEELL